MFDIFLNELKLEILKDDLIRNEIEKKKKQWKKLKLDIYMLYNLGL